MVAKHPLLHRLSLLLAAARFSDEETLELLQVLGATRSADLLKLVHEDRRRSKDDLESASPLTSPEAFLDNSTVIGSELTSQVERLLIQEAGLTRTEAADALEVALRRRRNTGRRYPFNSKEGFTKWLRQLSFDFPLSEILHAAATVRNAHVHGLADDWLKKE